MYFDTFLRFDLRFVLLNDFDLAVDDFKLLIDFFNSLLANYISSFILVKSNLSISIFLDEILNFCFLI